MEATFTSIQDMSKTSSILSSLQEIGQYFHQVCHASMSSEESQAAVPETLPLSGLSVSNEVYKNAMDVFHPLAYYLQNKAEDSQKEKLGEMLANSETIDLLCEGILHPFIKETSLQEPRKINHTHALQVVLLLHVCLMECSESLKMKQKLIECGCIYLLLKELRNMRRVISTDTDTNKFSRQLIQTATLVVNNCLSDNIDRFMQLYPDTDIDGAFTSYFNYPDSIVRLVCQLTYHHFSYYLHQSIHGSIDSLESILSYTRLLHIASESKQFVARVDKLFIDATDLMKVLQCLCTSAKNRKFLIESSDFHIAITSLLLREGEKEIEYALNLLLTYLTDGQPIAKKTLTKKKGKKEQLVPAEDSREETKKELFSRFPELVRQLQNVLANTKCYKKLCSAVLWYIQADADGDIHSCLRYVECCYEYQHFGECCYWSDCIGQQCATNAEAKSLHDYFLSYKAKAKYLIYQRQHVVLRRSEKCQDLGEMKQDRERVYENTKEVISILGSLKAKSYPLDLKCEQFLDYALMDYIRELNKRSSKDSVYCMLCHRKQTMVRSHTVPESLLKVIFKNSRDMKMVMIGPSSMSLDSHVKTLHTLTFNMLCSTCDNEVLSRDENIFIENIVKPVYQTSPNSHLEKFDKISYDKWLYRFCAGVIFRNLALNRGVSGFTNSNDIYELSRHCRSVVNTSLEGAASAIPTLISQSSEVEMKSTVAASENKFHIAIFFTPGMLEDQPSNLKEKISNLVRTLNSNIFIRLSSISISGTSSSLAKKCYFFAVHFGIFTIVAFLEPVPTKYHRFLVAPCNGELSIPANSDRQSLIPPGLLKMFEDCTEKAVKHYLEKLVEVEQEKKSVSLTVLKSNAAESLTGEPTSFNLLPPKYELNRQTNTITLLEGHSILLHYTVKFPSASHTVFLAIEDVRPMNPYVIIHSYLDTPTIMSQTFGYFITLPEFAFKDELNASHKMIMQQIRAKDLDLFKLPAKVLPDTMKRAGLQNYQSILYHLNRNSRFDQKCGCWYCCRKCDVCMLESTAGLSFSTHSEGDPQATPTLRFHDEKCKAFSNRSRDFPSSFSVKEPLKEVVFCITPSSSEELSSEVTGIHLLSIMLSSYDERKECPTHIAIDIYRVKKGNDQLPPDHFIALFDVSTYNSKVFGEFYLTDELRLEKPLLHNVRATVEKEQIQLLNDVIREAMQKSGLDVQYIRSVCMEDTVDHEPLLQATNSDDSCDQLTGLDFLKANVA